MNKTKVPEGYNTISPYFIVQNADKFYDFLKVVFGVEEKLILKNENGKITHAEVKLGDGMLMFGESNDEWSTLTSSVYLYVENCDDVFKKAVGLGAISIMDPENKPYGRSAGVKDTFGNTWWITSVN